MNYDIIPYWDRSMLLVFTLGNVSNIALTGLAYEGIKGTTGAPAAIAGRWVPGAQVHNVFDGTWYEMTGTTASPVWSLVPSSGSGITQLTGDVHAGPGTGSQAATVFGLRGVALNVAATVDASFYVFDIAGHFAPVVMSGDATMSHAGAILIGSIHGIVPKSVNVFDVQHTTVGGAAAEAVTITGVHATDHAYAQIVDPGTGVVSVVQAVCTLNTVTVTFSADPGSDAIVNILVTRATGL